MSEFTDKQHLPPAFHPAPAGQDGVLHALKGKLGMGTVAGPSVTSVGPDQFPLLELSPLRSEHELVTAYFDEVHSCGNHYVSDLNEFESGRRLVQLDAAGRGRALLAAAERHVHALVSCPADPATGPAWWCRLAAASAVMILSRSRFTLVRDGLFDLLLYQAVVPAEERAIDIERTGELIAMAERADASTPPSMGERFVLGQFRASLVPRSPFGKLPAEVTRLTRLIGDGACLCLAPGEIWSDAVNEDLSRMPPAEQEWWCELLAHASTATSARPSEKWLKRATELLEQVDEREFRVRLENWLPSVAKGPSALKRAIDTLGTADKMHKDCAVCLRGLLWMIPILPCRDQLIGQIVSVTLAGYRKIPGVGPRAVRVGNAGIYALSVMPTVKTIGQLGMLRARVTFLGAAREIETAFDEAAKALGMSPREIWELAMPAYGLEPGGRRCETFGEHRAELVVNGLDAQLHWYDPHGKQLKSVPAKLKRAHLEEIRALQSDWKNVRGTLSRQCQFIDRMMLFQRSWSITNWRAGYLDHPLVGTIAARLLWCVDGTPALFLKGRPTDVHGTVIDHGRTAEITYWHPVERSDQEVSAWRDRLEQLGITQPFKQVHREVFRLAGDEQKTADCLNGLRGHILRQPDFAPLAGARGWRFEEHLLNDPDSPPCTIPIEAWGLFAEFWVQRPGPAFGDDTDSRGRTLRVVTDQVRFRRLDSTLYDAYHRGGAAAMRELYGRNSQLDRPVPFEEVPPLVLSEILRDIDTFITALSVGNDPAWQHGGPAGRYRQYWHRYAFGELGLSASIRKQVLERLVPRLKIVDRCSLTDRFLVVQGRKRAYKIHIGSAYVLMTPEDRFLNLVPDARAATRIEGLFLPFEGDKTLSLILSKAFVLTEDHKINDPMITRQIDE